MNRIRIGRAADNDVTIDDSTVSRYHAELIIHPNGKLSITDLGSTNGTYINGNRISGTVSVDSTDIIKVGSSLIPWRNYLKNDHPHAQLHHSSENSRIEAHHASSAPITERHKRKSNTWAYVGIGAVVLVFVYFFLLKQSDASKLHGEWEWEWDRESVVIYFEKNGRYQERNYYGVIEEGRWELEEDLLILRPDDGRAMRFEYKFVTKRHLELRSTRDSDVLDLYKRS